MVHDLYLGRAPSSVGCLSARSSPSRASTRSTARAQALEDVVVRDGHRVGRDRSGRNGMGKTTLCNAIMGISPPTRARLDPLPRCRARSASRRTRSRTAASATCRRAVGCSRRSTVDEHLRMIEDARAARTWNVAGDLRALPAARRAQEDRRHPALRRRAADARDRPRAAHEPEAADHGRAVRGSRADDRREPDRDLQDARRPRGSRSS